MKRILTYLLIFGLVALFVWTGLFLYNKSAESPVVFTTESPFKASIVNKTVANGSIVPRKEVAIKPRVSGVIDKLYVEAGQFVTKGQRIAVIKIIPNVVNLNNAEAQLKTARINFNNAKREKERNEDLFKNKVISEMEYNGFLLTFRLREQEKEAAEDNLALIREGASRKAGKVSNVVTSTVEGMVLEVPVKEGFSVIESNNFNEGTTIASVANMGDMIFEGNVDESEVGKIKEGMPLSIKIGAIEGARFEGSLEYISPKGMDLDGTIQFQVRAAVNPTEGTFIRANYSANADIVLDRVDSVLAINEALLNFEEDGEKAFVEVETGEQKFEKRYVQLGLSDGIKIEVKSGVSLSEKIKSGEE